jgi:hypothetical protein
MSKTLHQPPTTDTLVRALFHFRATFSNAPQISNVVYPANEERQWCQINRTYQLKRQHAFEKERKPRFTKLPTGFFLNARNNDNLNHRRILLIFLFRIIYLYIKTD